MTSGDYERFTLIDGRRYAHILDLRTGYPVDHTRRVTIVCPDAELADALATAVFVLGPTEGLGLVDGVDGEFLFNPHTAFACRAVAHLRGAQAAIGHNGRWRK